MTTAELQYVHITTRRGPVGITAAPEAWESREMATVLIHGALGNAGDMFRWSTPLPNRLFIHLPGHEAPTLDENSVAAWVEALDEALATLQRPIFIVGNSLGGLLALCLPHPALALAPPLRTHNLWPVRQVLERETGPKVEVIRAVFREGQDFRQMVLGGDVITGNVPLMPPRATEMIPCLFEGDIAPSSLRVHRVESSHLLLKHQPNTCLKIVKALMAQPEQ